MSEPLKLPTLLIVDDDPDILKLFARVFSKYYQVYLFSRAEECLEHFPRADLIISDFQMPGIGGSGLIKAWEEDGSRVPLIIMTGLSAQDGQLAGAHELNISIVNKPFRISVMRAMVEELLAGDTPVQ